MQKYIAKFSLKSRGEEDFFVVRADEDIQILSSGLH